MGPHGRFDGMAYVAKHARNPEELDSYKAGSGRQGDTGNQYTQTTSGFDRYTYPADVTNRYDAPYMRSHVERQRAAEAQAVASPAPASTFFEQGGTTYGQVDYNEWWNSEERGTKHKKGHPIIKWFFIILLTLLVICAGVCAWYIHEFDSRVEANQSTPAEMANVLTAPVEGQPYYILLLGSDWREYTDLSNRADQKGDNQRADVIILARVDVENNQVTLVSVPRDTRWEHDGTVSKINESYNIGGAALTTQAVSELTGVPIAHTVEVHFSGFEGLVDALGGVEVTVPQPIEQWDALTAEFIELPAGTQVLDGKQAQIFARVRKNYSTGDVARQSNVRQLIYAIAQGIREQPLQDWPALGLEIANCVGTDMRFFDFVNLMKDFMEGDITMYTGTGPTIGGEDASAGGQWLCYANPEGWRRVMEVVEAGGDPSTVNPDEEFTGQGEEYMGNDQPVYTDEVSQEAIDQLSAEYYGDEGVEE